MIPIWAETSPTGIADWQVQLSADYNLPGMMFYCDFFARSDLNMIGEAAGRKSYNLSYIGWEYKWNLRASLKNESWTLTAYVNNIVDDRRMADWNSASTTCAFLRASIRPRVHTPSRKPSWST